MTIRFFSQQLCLSGISPRPVLPSSIRHFSHPLYFHIDRPRSFTYSAPIFATTSPYHFNLLYWTFFFESCHTIASPLFFHYYRVKLNYSVLQTNHSHVSVLLFICMCLFNSIYISVPNASARLIISFITHAFLTRNTNLLHPPSSSYSTRSALVDDFCIHFSIMYQRRSHRL